jgi:hypothetical protein
MWSLVVITLLGSALIARELGVGQWLTRVGHAMVTTTAVAQPAPKNLLVVVVQSPRISPAPVQNTNQIVLAGGQTVSQTDLFRLMNQRNAAVAQAQGWQAAYEQLARETADNCARNPGLRSCQQPAHRSARTYVP